MKLFLILLFLSSTAFAQKKVAVVKMIRGEVEIVILGKTTKLKVDDWVESGAVVKTQEKSFAKLVFIDKSQMNIGPGSEMKIEKFSNDEAGVIDLVKGKIRSQVTKDYLQMDKDKSKMFIKTPNAVMGIRGTDFMISTNGKTTSSVLFEGQVVFNNLPEGGASGTERLEDVVNKGVRMFPGEFSVVDPSRPEPTVPSLLNVQQKEVLEKNENFESDRSPSSGSESSVKSVVPAGLEGSVVSNNSDTLKNEVATVAAPVEAVKTESTAAANPEGFVNGDTVKPANGSFLHVESGVVIPPGPGSVLDPNTNSFIPSPESGKVAADGSFVPPKNVEITDDGKILVAVADKAGVVKVVEVPVPSPVKSAAVNLTATATFMQTAASSRTASTTNTAIGPAPAGAAAAPKNDILNASFAPTGLTDLSNQNRNTSGGVTNVNEAAQQFNNGPTPRVIYADKP